MPIPVVIVTSGGAPVTEATNGLGVPVAVAENGFGIPVTYVSQGGMPVVTEGSGEFLPAGGAYFVASPRKVLRNYSGASVRVARSSDSAEMDATFGEDGWIDDAVFTWGGADILTIVKFYDQGGSGREGLPGTNPYHLYQNGPGGKPSFAGSIDIPQQNSGMRRFDVSGLSLERTNVTALLAIEPYYNMSTARFELATGATRDLGLIEASTGGLSVGSYGNLATSLFIPCQPTIMSLKTSPTLATLRLGDLIASVAPAAPPLAAKLSTSIHFGVSVGDNTKYNAANLQLIAFYNPAQSEAAHEKAQELFYERPRSDKLIVFHGDSIPAGYGAFYGRGIPQYTRDALDALDNTFDLANRSLFGGRYVQSLSPSSGAMIGNIALPYGGNALAVFLAGGNDLQTGNTVAATVTAIQTGMTNVHNVAPDCKILLCSMVPRNSGDAEFGTTGSGELVASMAANYASWGAEAFVDLWSDATLRANIADATWFYDGTHTREPANEHIGGLIADAINGLFP